MAADAAAPIREWKIFTYFTATDVQADALQERMTEALADLFTPFDRPEHERPHFHFSGMRPISGPRCFALRWALTDLWNALRRGEVL